MDWFYLLDVYNTFLAAFLKIIIHPFNKYQSCTIFCLFFQFQSNVHVNSTKTLHIFRKNSKHSMSSKVPKNLNINIYFLVLLKCVANKELNNYGIYVDEYGQICHSCSVKDVKDTVLNQIHHSTNRGLLKITHIVPLSKKIDS